MPNCFDGCPDTKCWQNGHDVEPLEACSQQPMMDRFKRDEHIIRKYPCTKCMHRIFRTVCVRCTHYEKPA